MICTVVQLNLKRQYKVPGLYALFWTNSTFFGHFGKFFLIFSTFFDVPWKLAILSQYILFVTYFLYYSYTIKYVFGKNGQFSWHIKKGREYYKKSIKVSKKCWIGSKERIQTWNFFLIAKPFSFIPVCRIKSKIKEVWEVF